MKAVPGGGKTGASQIKPAKRMIPVKPEGESQLTRDHVGCLTGIGCLRMDMDHKGVFTHRPDATGCAENDGCKFVTLSDFGCQQWNG